ncbi:MAG: methylenetetrahydrofolate--tRNA-(uracil(54)-C(5))-methyltransferase (FADH(2)-oxidizing) TrmFO [Clostridia bacterium]|nr:methylenetetrahydrofolate--tRNA-(uracil(54)-C(5))-methyltransferase (FADH(2)-oxidizing) TrmFO [Clostridia bacterium]
MEKKTVNVVGAGLAGCEAAWQAAKSGAKVRLYEMKPKKRIPAHSSSYFCELCCSNSFRAEGLSNAIGLLKVELREMGSLIMKCADLTRVPAGGALAVDREAFPRAVTEHIKNEPNIEIIEKEIDTLEFDCPTVIATGPLTSDALAGRIAEFFGSEGLHFFDAAAPTVTFESVDMQKAYFASRYGKGTPDYINCPMTKEEYESFYEALINAETAEIRDFENNVFEGCMPVETMAARGKETLLFGPLKPVGLPDPKTGKTPYAVVQLRKDNAAETVYNIVGFQTHLKFPEQRRVFGMIPGLENAEFVRYGVMHRNTFISSPGNLTAAYETVKRKNLFFAGQMTGVEGYIESCSSGFVAGINAAREDRFIFPPETAIGALAHYISNENITDFQPMNVNFGIFPPLVWTGKKPKKADRKEMYSQRALEIIKNTEFYMRGQEK